MRRIFGQMSLRYQNTKTSTRLVAAILIVVIATALSWSLGWDPVVAAIGTSAVYLALEVLVFKPYFVSAGIVTAMFWVGVAVYMSFYEQSLKAFYEKGQIQYILTVVYALLTLATIITLLLNWYVAYGRYWLNLTASFLMYFLAFIFLPMTGINMLYIPMIALVPVVVWVFVRRLWMHRRDKHENVDNIFFAQEDAAFPNRMSKKFKKGHMMQEGRTLVVNTNRHILLMFPVTPRHALELTYKQVSLDGEDITFVMSHLTKQLSTISKTAKINGKKLFPIVYVTNDKMERPITPVSYRSKKRPDVVEGTVFYVNKKDFSRFMKEIQLATPLTQKEKERYAKAFNSTAEEPKPEEVTESS